MGAAEAQHPIANCLADRSRTSAVGVVLATAAFSVAAGPTGLLTSIAVVITWCLLSAPFAFAVGQLAFIVLFPAGSSLSQLALIEVGLLSILLGSVLRLDKPGRAVTVIVLAFAGLGTSAWVGFKMADTLWPAVLTVAASAIIAVYGLHRYERVRLGLVEAS
jgi:hypothetical protein